MIATARPGAGPGARDVRVARSPPWGRSRGSETERVAAIGGPLRFWLPREPFVHEHAMTRLLDSDLWYRTWRVRTDARLIYLLSPNEPLLAAGKHEPHEGQPTRSLDPLNPRRYLLSL